MDWILRSDGALCLSGYPIRIIHDRKNGYFLLISDWHPLKKSFHTLSGAKYEATYRLIDEIKEFSLEEEKSFPIIPLG
jgi:hypothetical protein